MLAIGLSTVFTSLSFAPHGLGFLIWVGLVPLVGFFDRPRANKIYFYSGWLYGALVTAYFHRWMFSLDAFSPLTGVASLWLLLSLYLGLFYGAGFYVYGWLIKKCPQKIKSFASVILFPSVWVCIEWTRSLGPFGNPAAALGYSQAGATPVLTLAAAVGVFGVSWIIVAFNSWVKILISSNKPFLHVGLMIGLWYGLLVYSGAYLAHPIPDRIVGIGVVQPQHDQTLKMTPRAWSRLRSSLMAASRHLQKADVIFWPETIVPSLNLEDPGFVRRLRRLSGQLSTPIIFGTPILDKGKYYNAISAMSPTGLLQQEYRKIKLMPFGEYLPFRSWMAPLSISFLLLSEDYHPGFQFQSPIQIRDLSFGSAVCLESIYPQYLRRATLAGADILAVFANHAWFFDSPASAQHLEMTRVRAAENQRHVVMATNWGYSAIITPSGKLKQITPFNQPSQLESTIGISPTDTVFTQTGHWPILALSLLILGYFWGIAWSSRM